MAFDDKIYDTDLKKLATNMFPVLTRMKRTLALTNGMIAGVLDLFSRFTSFKNFIVYWLGIDSQVCYMQKALNDKYDAADRRIIIVDGIAYNPVPLYQPDENKPVTFSQPSENKPVVLYTVAETAQFTSDFIVKVPVFVAFDYTEMRAFIDSMKLPTKTYQILIV